VGKAKMADSQDFGSDLATRAGGRSKRAPLVVQNPDEPSDEEEEEVQPTPRGGARTARGRAPLVVQNPDEESDDEEKSGDEDGPDEVDSDQVGDEDEDSDEDGDEDGYVVSGDDDRPTAGAQPITAEGRHRVKYSHLPTGMERAMIKRR
jgi:hypothetical protein